MLYGHVATVSTAGLGTARMTVIGTTTIFCDDCYHHEVVCDHCAIGYMSAMPFFVMAVFCSGLQG